MQLGSKLFCVGLAATMHLCGADPRIGSWKLIAARSSVDPPRKLSITPQGNGVHIALSGTAHIDFTANWDGRDSSVQNVVAFNRVGVRKIDKHQTEIQEKKDGLPVATLRNKVSADGRELTVVTIQRGRPDQIEVWDRTGGAKDATNPFIGDWTQDLSETRLRQGMILRFEPQGTDVVHFVGDYSYTASPDGRDYLLRGSPNDTVAITIVDAHTVESVYKRGDETAGRDRWVVSSDGSHMTVTMAGASADGESLKEALTFERQK